MDHTAGSLWCATAIDADGQYSGYWGDCVPCAGGDDDTTSALAERQADPRRDPMLCQ